MNKEQEELLEYLIKIKKQKIKSIKISFDINILTLN